MKKPVAAVKLTGKSSYLTNKDIRVLIEAHDSEIQELRTTVVKLTTMLDVVVKHFAFEIALRPIGVGVSNVGK